VSICGFHSSPSSPPAGFRLNRFGELSHFEL
jgi:hypothetical protein